MEKAQENLPSDASTAQIQAEVNRLLKENNESFTMQLYDVPLENRNGEATVVLPPGLQGITQLVGLHDTTDPNSHVSDAISQDSVEAYKENLQEMNALLSHFLVNGADALTDAEQGTVNYFIKLSAQAGLDLETFALYLNNLATYLYEGNSLDIFTYFPPSIEELQKLFGMKPSPKTSKTPSPTKTPTPTPPPPPPPPHPVGMVMLSHDMSPMSWHHNSANPLLFILSPYYDVEKAIPTSEKLNVYMKTDDHLYDVTRRKHTFKAWYDSKRFTYEIRSAWDEPYEIWHDAETDENGNVISSGWLEKGVNHIDVCRASYSADDAYSKTWPIYYDVPQSDIYKSTTGDVTISNGHNTISINGLDLHGVGGPGAQTITWNGKGGSFPTYGNHYIDRYASASTGDAKAGWDGLVGNAHGVVNGAWRISGTIDYTFGALIVKTHSSTDKEPGWGTPDSDEKNEVIPKYFDNGLYIGTATAHYEGGRTFSANNKKVTVHTPVVAQKVKLDITPFINQKAGYNPSDTSKRYVQLDEGFSVTIPNTGVHINSKGYSPGGALRKYNSYSPYNEDNRATKWGWLKDVRLPFDVYVYNKAKTKTYFLPANTWLSEGAETKGRTDLSEIDENKETKYNFLVPVWVPELIYDGQKDGSGKYVSGHGGQIEIRVVAENAFDKNGKPVSTKIVKEQEEANKEFANYVAIKKFSVEVIGKIYDFNVLDSSDPDWINKVGMFFGGGFVPSGVNANNFPFGQTKTPVLGKTNPYSQNMNQSYIYAQKLGYSFVFDFKTKGRKTQNVSIGIAGEKGNEDFYFIPKTGGEVKQVYLYYLDKDGVYKRIVKGAGGLDNTTQIEINYNDKFMRVTAEEKTLTSRIYGLEKVPGAPFDYSVKTPVGTLANLNIPMKTRFVYNNFQEYAEEGRNLYKQKQTKIEQDALYAVQHTYNNNSDPKFNFNQIETGKELVYGSVGHWYVGYALPATTVPVDPIIIPPGTPEPRVDELIKAKTPGLILKGGYIGVAFDFDLGTPDNYLNYTGPDYVNPDGTVMNKDDKAGASKYTNPERDWTEAFNKTKVPNKVVALFETDYSSKVDNHTVLAH